LIDLDTKIFFLSLLEILIFFLEHEYNSKTLEKISEGERIETIQKGFQLNKEGKMSLKKYYIGTEKYSLF
jgi:hypothetical protein